MMKKRISLGIQELLRDPDWRHAGKWFLLAGLVGVVAGLGALIFQFLSHELFQFALVDGAGYHPRPAGGEAVIDSSERPLTPWLLVCIPAVGGLLSGWLVYSFAPEAEGHGTDGALEAYHFKAGVIRPRVPLVKTIASVLTLGTGGSGGREGPIAQIGAGFGSYLATRLKLSSADRRILLAAGMGAGVGAIFRAPLAGALFASEIHYREPEFESEAIIPSAIASITSYCVFSLVYGWQPLFSTAEFNFRDPWELIPYAGLAIAVSLGAFLFIRVFYGLHDFFKRLAMPAFLKPALGGLATGLLALCCYGLVRDRDVLSVMGFGYGALQGALNGEVAVGILLLVALGKMVATGLTIGSGGSGGVFGPSMVIGGSIGGAVGQGLHTLMPELVRYPGAYVLVGMAGFFAGAAKTPISTIIMVSEMTGNYNLLLPALWVTTFCYLSLRRTGLYRQQVATKADSPAHRGDFHFDILEGIKVADVMTPRQEVITFPSSTSLGTILHRVSETQQTCFPVTDVDGRISGVLSLSDIREYLYEEDLWNLAIAEDIAVTDVARVLPQDNLSVANRRFTRRNLDELSVVCEEDPGRLVGIIRRKDVLDAYNRRLWDMREEASQSR